LVLFSVNIGFPLIKLAKKLKAVGAIHELPLLFQQTLIKLAKKLKVWRVPKANNWLAKTFPLIRAG
jgi:hypothetical protein